jgi:hypothetical protein
LNWTPSVGSGIDAHLAHLAHNIDVSSGVAHSQMPSNCPSGWLPFSAQQSLVLSRVKSDPALALQNSTPFAIKFLFPGPISHILSDVLVVLSKYFGLSYPPSSPRDPGSGPLPSACLKLLEVSRKKDEGAAKDDWLAHTKEGGRPVIAPQNNTLELRGGMG